MELIRTNDIYVMKTAGAHEKDVPKAAGFWFHTTRGCRRTGRCKACRAGVEIGWWTPSIETARHLASYATDPALRAELTGLTETKKEAVAASYAHDADVDLVCADGLSYLPFQRAGIAYGLTHQNVLIADEMGLGKTIQALGIINNDASIRTVLCLVPASLRVNWRREAEKWLVRSFSFHLISEKGGEVPDDATFVICNYDRLSRGGLAAKLSAKAWDLIIMDEAHYLKNPKASRSKLVLGYSEKDEETGRWVRRPGIVDSCRRRVALTGSPFPNRPIEIQPLAGALCPAEFGNFFQFGKTYCGAHQTRFGWDFSGCTRPAELGEKLRQHIMVRRLKADVLTELPRKIRQIVHLDPNGSSSLVAAEMREFDESAHQARLSALERELTTLDPVQNRAEYERVVRDMTDIEGVLFSEMSRTRHRTAKAKVSAVVDYLTGELESVEKIIVFAHHSKDPDDPIPALQAAFGDAAVSVTDDTPVDARQALVDRFQTDPSCRVFIGGIIAAGVGLTLTAASNVYFAELDWVPANISQAEDRAHRIGQTCTVVVKHLVFDGSLDARMAQRLVEKQAVMDAILDVRGVDSDLTKQDAIEAAAARVATPAPVPTSSRPGTAVPFTPSTMTTTHRRTHETRATTRATVLRADLDATVETTLRHDFCGGCGASITVAAGSDGMNDFCAHCAAA